MARPPRENGPKSHQGPSEDDADQGAHHIRRNETSNAEVEGAACHNAETCSHCELGRGSGGGH